MKVKKILFGTATLAALLTAASGPARAQASPSPADARTLEYGKDVYKVKGNCQFCHKWDASGDQGYGGNASSLRKTFLTPEQFAEVIKCGRPGTGMPSPMLRRRPRGPILERSAG